MSNQQLHDYLKQLKEQRNHADLVDSEHQQRLDELVESLEQQQLYPDSFDQYSVLAEEVKLMIVSYEAEHPTIASVLNGIHGVLNNFRI